MNLSLGEFQALVAKAFRGAGYSWGLTEDAAFAARRIAGTGAPIGEIVVRLLASVDGQPLETRMPNARWQSSGSGLCPVCVGASIADQAGCERLEVGPTYEPVLVAPFLASVLQPDSAGGYLIEWATGRCEISHLGIATAGQVPDEGVELVISRRRVTMPPQPRLDRIELSEGTHEQLRKYAHRTYAPATEASRAGAGAADDNG